MVKRDPGARGRASDLVAFDVGNTNTVVGLFRGDELAARFRLSTDLARTSDEVAATLAVLLGRVGFEPTAAAGVVVSSVVPPLRSTYARLAREYFGCEALFVEPGVKTGMAMRYENPSEVGADRIVNAVAGRERYGAPVIVVDFGTALTFDVVNVEGEYAGGIIAPGPGIASEALFSQASRLSRVEIREPRELVGRTTVGALQSGLYYGWLGLVDGILERLLAEMPEIETGIETVVGTGGEAEWIAAGSRYLRVVDHDLTLRGLQRIFELNQG